MRSFLRFPSAELREVADGREESGGEGLAKIGVLETVDLVRVHGGVQG